MKLLPNKFRNGYCRNRKRIILFEWIVEYYKNIPYFHKNIINISLFLYILSFFSSILNKILILDTQEVNYSVLYRLFTSVLVPSDTINFFLILVLWLNETTFVEKTVGTIQYAIDFFINLIIIQILFIITSLTIQIKYSGNFLQSSGFWPIVIYEIVLICQKNPEDIVNFYYFVYDFRAKYFPISLIFFVIVLNDFQFKLDIFIGLLYGYVNYRYLENVFTFPKMKKKLELIFIQKFRKSSSIYSI